MFSHVLKNTASVLMLIFAAFSLSGLTASYAEEFLEESEESLPYVVLKAGSDFVADGSEASEKQIPVLMFFSMEHCPFCNEVEEDYLKPMLRNSDYDDKIIIRKIKIDDNKKLRDFSGKEVDAGKFSERYNISMVPTLILVNANGKKTSPSIVGIANKHYYSAELDQAIDASTQKMRALAKR